MLYSDLLAPHLVAGSVPEAYNEEVRQAVRRGTDLISQLLSFARQQQEEPDVFSLNSLLRSLREVLARMIGEEVEIVYELAEAPCNVRVTPVQIEQVVFNLALNSRDAMPGGGTIRIRTEEVAHQKDRMAQVVLIVADSGCGMDQATLARIFEPFYSTKPHGKGTGLGLSTVQSIVTRCGGSVWVESSPGHGTEVRILLPRADVPSETKSSSPPMADVPPGSETVLVVEDDTAVRDSIREALAQCGYIVKVAGDGPEALAAVAGMERPPDLLITDLVLPGISGRELARRLRSTGASIPTLFISGYEQSTTAHDADNFVFAKPFSRGALARKVRQLLDCGKPGSVRHGE
jgi:CheY-like chemotaxis protein/two-component sensor histidine kinase